jgi:hypothetical protein
MVLTFCRAMKAILKITNPVTLINNMMNLFFAKPLGAKNIYERIMTVVTEVSRTERDIKELQKLINNKNVATKVAAWVAKNYNPVTFESSSIMPEEASEAEYHIDGVKDPVTYILSILQDPSIEPFVGSAEIRKILDNDGLNLVKNLVALEMRKKDKTEFIGVSLGGYK